MMYNSTPHSTTGKSSSELFYQRQFRDKIPTVMDIENKVTDQEIRDKNTEKKGKRKEYGDQKKHHMRVSYDLKIGGKVYLKNMNKENKLTPNFCPITHTVTEVKSEDVKVRNDLTGKEYRRNAIHLKKVDRS